MGVREEKWGKGEGRTGRQEERCGERAERSEGDSADKRSKQGKSFLEWCKHRRMQMTSLNKREIWRAEVHPQVWCTTS